MQTPLPKRFYKSVDVQDEGGEGFSVRLDGRPVRTPAAATLRLPNESAARLVADEYAAQGDEIDPMTMPVTRLVNTAIDGVASEMDAVAEDILRYASTDLVCYRADSPRELVERQAEAWDPVLDWMRSALGARFVLAEGVMHVEQPRESIALLGAHLRPRREALRLAALHVMTNLTGSALIALAVEAGALDAEAAWRAAHVDEDWNIHQWGEDAEAAAHRAARKRDMMGAVALLKALDTPTA
jgi:chaperone required for assembly of F1-ATPase